VDFLQWADLFTWDEDITGINTAQPSNFAPCSLDTVAAETWTWPIGQEIDTGCDAINNPDSNAQQGSQDPLWPEIDLVVDAPMLFRHFNDHVIDQMGSLPIHEKSAWRILNLSSALMTLNEMTILLTNRENIKHAPLANFYAVIAVSAFHLSLNFASFPDPPRTVAHWKRLTNQAYAAAKLHINLTLEKESLAPGKAKYKDQLMSINATLATAVRSLLSSESKQPSRTKL
jgi:arginine metabolism regulation protein II